MGKGVKEMQERPKRWAEYQAWINQKLREEDPFTKCAEWTQEMQAEFPELVRVRGTVLLSCLWERYHWWLVEPETQQVVDPTAEQFGQEYYCGGSRIVAYQPRDESEPEPTGMCCNCGELCYGGRTELCSVECERAYRAYLMGETRGYGRW